MSGENLIYSVATDGHRQAYLDLLGPMFGLEPVTGRMTGALFRKLVAAKRLLFAALDEDMAGFAACACARSLLRRPTTALFLRAQKCFESDRWYYPVKRRTFRAIRRLPHLTIATITPFTVAPHYAEVAHVGVYDPQYWDLHDGFTLRQPQSTALSDEVMRQAQGRKICCALGVLNTAKGIGFLAETIERNAETTDHVLIVCAGRVSPDAADHARRLSASGALIIDRFVTDAELESLYRVADAVWACYAPDYDQASGVFGRAIQLGIPVIVRTGSLIAKFAAENEVFHRAVAFGEHNALAETLRRLERRSKVTLAPGIYHSALVGSWRNSFAETIGKSLNSHRSCNGRK